MNYPYMILYQGKIAARTLTRIGAIKLRTKLLKEKGWAEVDVKVVMAYPVDNKGVSSNGN